MTARQSFRGRRDRWTVLVLAVAVSLVCVGLIRAQQDGSPTAPSPSPGATPAGSPSPVPSVALTYDAVFNGDATGTSDVTKALRVFLESHDGEHVALAVDGVYRVTQLTFTATDLTVDFRGARIEGSQIGAKGILRLQTSADVVLNDPMVFGTGYIWAEEDQNEHGIHVDGGSDIVINRPVTRDTRGDGIYVNYEGSRNVPPVGIVINEPDIERAARNGISPLAGQVTIVGGHISNTGLHGVDFEPNDDIGARSIVGIVDSVDIRNHGDIPDIEITSYAVAAGGYSDATKTSMIVRGLSGDILNMTIRFTATVVVRDNVSDTTTTADFPGSGDVTFTDNTRIIRR